jgi:hypothetical protein
LIITQASVGNFAANDVCGVQAGDGGAGEEQEKEEFAHIESENSAFFFLRYKSLQ